MNPIKPNTDTAVDSRSSMQPGFLEEDPDIELVQQGLEVAENELRDAVADAYEASARLSDDPVAALDDIDYAEGEEPSTTPELAAMHEEFLPSDEND